MTDRPDLTTAPASPQAPQRRLLFVVLAGILAVIGALVASYYFAMRPVPLRIAVGPAGSEDVKVVQALAQGFAEKHSHIRLRLVQTDGVAASAHALAERNTDLAIIRGDLGVPDNAQAVATLRKNVVVLWAVDAKGKSKKAAKITRIEQLAGHRVGVIGRTPANINLFKVILQQYGIDPDRVEIIPLPANDVTEAIRSQKADAYLAAGPVNSKVTAEAIAASTHHGGNPAFLAVDSADAIAQNHSNYEASEIPAGAFSGSPIRPDEEIKTISFSHHIVARKDLSEATIAAFTRQLFAVRQQVLAEFPLAAKIETPDTDKDAAIPVHPGAAAFVDGDEKSFIDRYGDYIWWALMALSAMGSAGAWFAGILKTDERKTNRSERDHLLEMLSIVRRCDSIEEMDRMQAEADDILRKTLLCYEHGGIAEGALTAFNIALGQFHNAIADRKALLISAPPGSPRAAPLRVTGAL
jgi:TRAP transporter TAXI family solute receptor